MMREYEPLCGKVTQKLDDCLHVKVMGRCMIAQVFYVGTDALINVGDRIIVVGQQGIALLVVPANNATFLA